MWRIKRKKKDVDPFSLRDKHQRYYQTSTHQRWRLAVLNRDPLCVECEQQGVIEPATVADHIESLTNRWDLRSSIDNGQGLCALCHNKKSGNERIAYSKVKQELTVNSTMTELNNWFE